MNIEELELEEITLDCLEMPRDDSEGATYRDYELDDLLHGPEWAEDELDKLLKSI